jgi:AcrR family transcriptional regulator
VVAAPERSGLDPEAFHDEVEDLLRRASRPRRTTRRRDATAETLDALITATGELIEAYGVEGVRIADVSERAGFGASSVYHLFGDRDGLLAATLTDRFDRSIVGSASIQQMAALMDDGREAVVEFGRRYLTSTYTDPAREQSLWNRVTALGAACHRPLLQERLRDALADYVGRMSEVLIGAQRGGVIRADVDPVALALYGQAHQFGLLANRYAIEPLPMQAWETVAMRTMHMVSPDSPDPEVALPGLGRGVVAEPEAPARAPQQVPDDERAQLAVSLALAAFAEGGPEAVVIADIREAVSGSAGWFHRTFGDRDGLLDEVRLTLFDERLGAETDGLVGVLRASRSPQEFTGRMIVLAAGALEGATRAQLWFRVEVLSALDGRPGLRRAIAEIDARHTGTLTAAVVDAQARGIVAVDLDARAVARFAQGMHFGFLLSAVSGLAPTGLQWRSVFERVVWGVTPGAVHSS